LREGERERERERERESVCDRKRCIETDCKIKFIAFNWTKNNLEKAESDHSCYFNMCNLKTLSVILFKKIKLLLMKNYKCILLFFVL
jgi:hypothetical protein